MKGEIKRFKFREEYFNKIETLPTREKKLAFYKAVIDYGLYNKSPDFKADNELLKSWEEVKKLLDKDKEQKRRGATARGQNAKRAEIKTRL